MSISRLPHMIIATLTTLAAGWAAAAGTDYKSWDGWSASAQRTATSAVTGSLATLFAVPSTGTANYNGAVLGAENRAGNVGIIIGTAALNADFGGRQLTGSFNNLRRLSGTPLGGSATPVNAIVDASWGATNRISGTLSANTSNNGVMSGNVNAVFFGLTPAANVAGSWTLAGGNTTAAGAFAARKQ